MKISFNECNKILSTLPVGYYCGRRIPIALDEEAKTSYYTPMDDSICVSYPIIAKGVSALPDGADLEKSVRSMLYHETSHAILTPTGYMNPYDNETVRFALNVFEDERIETLLANFYMNVNFKAQLYNICGGPKTPKDAPTAFFNIVRFRSGPTKFVNKVSQIIETYRNINGATYYSGSYRCAVWDFYREVEAMFGKSPAIFAPPMLDIKMNMKGEGESKDGAKMSANGKGEQNGDAEGKSESAVMADSDPAHGHSDALTAEQIGKILEQVFKPATNLPDHKREQVEKFQKMLEVLFANFNKKTSGGNGVNAYSGVFNPRAVVRKDYRYFERSITSHGNNKFGSIHLNLVLDRSGSFCNNQDETNAILTILSDFERRNKNFSMDVFFIGEEMTHAKTPKERLMRCEGGNNIPDEAAEMFRKAQKPNTFNYNIVLFDGDALSDCWGEGLEEKAKRFKTFDHKQTFLITDSDNERYLRRKPYQSAKVIVTSDYNRELIKNITRAFQTMLS